MTKKYASNDKNQLLVENFKKFMEEGDFSPALDEAEWASRTGDRTHPLNIFNDIAVEIKDAGGDFEEIHKAAQKHEDPRVAALSAMAMMTLSKKKPEDPTEQFQQALRIWFLGDLNASETMERAVERPPMEVGWWNSLTRSKPWLMKIFQNKEYQKMMEYYNDFIDYGEKMEKVDQDHDQLDPADQKKYKHFQSDWYRRFIEIPARKREKEREKEEKRHRRRYSPSAKSSRYSNLLDTEVPYQSAAERGRANAWKHSQRVRHGKGPEGSTYRENKKYSSFEEQQKLTENFRRFVEDEDSKED